MRNIVLTLTAAFAVAQGVALGQTGPPKEAIYITDAQVKEVLKYAGQGRDQTLRVIDMGTYAMSIGIVHRGKTGAPRPPAPPPATPPPPDVPCGLKEAPPGAKISPTAGMIVHTDTVETYIITSGEGTLVTGGVMLNGHKTPADDVIVTTLNGPSCTGRSVGDIVTRHMGVGDIAIIPAGVPHGWVDIPDHVDYYSVRPDPNKVLAHGYVNEHLNDAK